MRHILNALLFAGALTLFSTPGVTAKQSTEQPAVKPQASEPNQTSSHKRHHRRNSTTPRRRHHKTSSKH